MNKLRDYILALGGLLFGFIFGLTYALHSEPLESSTLKLGDCVTELGYETIEMVSIALPSGYIQTKFINQYTKEPTKEIYSPDQVKKLYKVECTK